MENKVVGHGVADPEQLLANPMNFRVHTQFQQSLLNSTMEEIGIVKSVTVNRNTGFIVDGHLRVLLALRKGVKEIPVEYVDLTEDEEKKALLLLDYITSKAGLDLDKVQALMNETGSSEIIHLMEGDLFPEAKKVLKKIREQMDVEISAPAEHLGNDELEIQIVRGMGLKLGQSYLVCADPATEMDVWMPFLKRMTGEVTPMGLLWWGGMFAAMTDEPYFICQPDVLTCEIIVKLYAKHFGKDAIEEVLVVEEQNV